MTGIAAAYDPDGSVSSEDISALLDTLDYRGHDGRDHVVHASAALGHQHFWTTPEAEGEGQPITEDGVTVTLDGRIDDREELRSALPDDRRPDESASDARLVVAAYRTWGPDAFDRLVGVFAVVVWDERRGRLVCARGPAGLRELYYSTVNGRVVVGSDPGTVLAAPGVHRDVDDGVLGERLLGEYASRGDTVYDAVRTVPAGSYVTFDGTDSSVTRFWDPASLDRLSITDPEALADELADRLRDAVGTRLRSRETPHVLLSGGLDSTTVAAIAAERDDADLRAISMQFEDPEAMDDPESARAERRRVEAFVDEYDLPLALYSLDDAAAPLDVEAYAEPRLEKPVLVGIEAPKREVYGRIADAGGRVALTGEFGNLFDGNRFAYHDLFRERKLGRGIADLLADPLPARHLLLGYVLAPAFPGLARRLFEWRSDDEDAFFPDWLAGEFVDRTALRDRLENDAGWSDFDRTSMQGTYDDHYRSNQLLYFGRDRRRALAAGVETRHPFADRRVLEFVYALPTGARLRGGVDKFFFRHLAAELLPPAVQDQSHPFRFDPVIQRGLRENAETLETLVTDRELVDRGIVDAAVVDRLLEGFLDGDEVARMVLWRLAAAELWLQNR
ncbi:hypothetical protein BRC81_12160 [Halobacteriales archaeon QS_1_68_20]|nr:MAG: hypothetical protein BRC81_12160 [Halobacteriales archaeon QS_1_68_20]